jgi:hypothetical protein
MWSSLHEGEAVLPGLGWRNSTLLASAPCMDDRTMVTICVMQSTSSSRLIAVGNLATQ